MQLICQPRPGRTRRAGAGKRMALRSRERRVREYRIISCDKRRKHTSSKDRTGLKSGMRRPAWSWWCIQSPSSLTSVVLSAVVFCCSGGRGAKPPVAGPSAAVGLSKYVCDPWRCGRAESQCTGVSQGGHDLNPGFHLACDAATDGRTAVGIGKPHFFGKRLLARPRVRLRACRAN